LTEKQKRYVQDGEEVLDSGEVQDVEEEIRDK
jgi:hypothetical protein